MVQQSLLPLVHIWSHCCISPVCARSFASLKCLSNMFIFCHSSRFLSPFVQHCFSFLPSLIAFCVNSLPFLGLFWLPLRFSSKVSIPKATRTLDQFLFSSLNAIIAGVPMVDYYAQGPVYHPPGYDYTQQEEEWDREGLLDPAWEKQQKKVCVNFEQRRAKPISDLHCLVQFSPEKGWYFHRSHRRRLPQWAQAHAPVGSHLRRGSPSPRQRKDAFPQDCQRE